jgi:NDP-sugar pyrophosphorylase family protein
VLDSAGADRGGASIAGLAACTVGAADDASLTRCEIIDPVSIAGGCLLEDCCIGPYVSLGLGVSVTGASITNSILMEGAKVAGNMVIEDSIVGSRSRLEAGSGARTVKLFLDSDSIMELE